MDASYKAIAIIMVAFFMHAWLIKTNLLNISFVYQNFSIIKAQLAITTYMAICIYTYTYTILSVLCNFIHNR